MNSWEREKEPPFIIFNNSALIQTTKKYTLKNVKEHDLGKLFCVLFVVLPQSALFRFEFKFECSAEGIRGDQSCEWNNRIHAK